MKAFETTSITDKKGYLKLNMPLLVKEKAVKIIVLMDENDADDIYKITDGKPFNDKK